MFAHLSDESLLDRLWLFHVGASPRVPAPSPRAAGMIRRARALANGQAIAEEALTTGDPRKLAKLLEPSSLAGLSPELLHHLALYYARVAEAVEPVTPDSASSARVRSLAAWLALANAGDYLGRLARDIAGGAMPERELLRFVDALPLDVIDDLGRRALEGAAARTPESRSALRVLARVKDACALAGVAPPLEGRAVARAEAKRAEAIEAALLPIEEALAEATARGTVVTEARALLERAIAVWQVTEFDELPELFVVRHVTDVAWELYGASKWDALRALLAPFWGMVESLEQRILADPTKIAYAAPCAQMLVFRSELESPLHRQLEVVERAVKLHPTHRNGRLVLASYLCEEATRLVDKSPLYTNTHDLATAEAHVARAEKLYPTSKRIAPAKAKIEAAKRRPSFPFGGPR